MFTHTITVAGLDEMQLLSHTYLRKLHTGMRIDDPGSRTLSVTSKTGSLLGISIDDAIKIVTIYHFYKTGMHGRAKLVLNSSFIMI